jgi:hypothetical protein
MDAADHEETDLRVWNPETGDWVVVSVAAKGVVMEVDGDDGLIQIGAGADGTLRASSYAGAVGRYSPAFSVDLRHLPTADQAAEAAAELSTGDRPSEPPMTAVLWRAERREPPPDVARGYREMVAFDDSACVDVIAPDGRRVQVVFHPDGHTLVRGWSGFYENIKTEEETNSHLREMGPGDEVASMSMVIPRVPENIRQARDQRHADLVRRRAAAPGWSLGND